MDLKTGRLYWPAVTSPPPRCAALRDDLQCDAAVIGAGLTGALIAHALVEAGLDVVVLEKRKAGEGSTSASTALVLYEVDQPLIKLVKRRGRRDAIKSYQCCLEAIVSLEKLVARLGLIAAFSGDTASIARVAPDTSRGSKKNSPSDGGRDSMLNS